MNAYKENLKHQIEVLEGKLNRMKRDLNTPIVINYWQPAEGERYYYVNYLGLVDSTSYASGYYKDKVRYRVFKTEAEAERYAKYIKAEETLRRVIAEANEGYVPSFVGWCGDKYTVGYIPETGEVSVFYAYKGKTYPKWLYIKSEELTEKLIKEYREEFITYFSY